MKKEDRCAQNLNLLQEDALIGLMWEDFNKNDMKHLDYDKVRRFAVSIQTDGEICGRLDAEAAAEEEEKGGAAPPSPDISRPTPAPTPTRAIWHGMIC